MFLCLSTKSTITATTSTSIKKSGLDKRTVPGVSEKGGER